MLKLKDQVTLSTSSLYARKEFQVKGDHLSTKVSGTIVKVLCDTEDGWYTVKFKSNGSDKTNTYLEGMLVKVK